MKGIYRDPQSVEGSPPLFPSYSSVSSLGAVLEGEPPGLVPALRTVTGEFQRVPYHLSQEPDINIPPLGSAAEATSLTNVRSSSPCDQRDPSAMSREKSPSVFSSFRAVASPQVEPLADTLRSSEDVDMSKSPNASAPESSLHGVPTAPVPPSVNLGAVEVATTSLEAHPSPDTVVEEVNVVPPGIDVLHLPAVEEVWEEMPKEDPQLRAAAPSSLPPNLAESSDVSPSIIEEVKEQEEEPIGQTIAPPAALEISGAMEVTEPLISRVHVEGSSVTDANVPADHPVEAEAILDPDMALPTIHGTEEEPRSSPLSRSDSEAAVANEALSSDGSSSGPPAEEEEREASTTSSSMSRDDSVAEEKRFMDEFGFILDEKSKRAEDEYLLHRDGSKLKRSELKWGSITSDWSTHREKHKEFIKRRCRKGIPNHFRKVAWQRLLQSDTQMKEAGRAGLYTALQEKEVSSFGSSSSLDAVDRVIQRDLDRTFPTHVLFTEKEGPGQTHLFHVLHAYASIDPEVNYAQGMAFVVGALSTQLDEEETFWAFYQLMFQKPWELRELYRPGFPLLHQLFFQLQCLMKKVVPRLASRLECAAVEPSYYASQWFLTLFVGVLPFRAVVRIWDVFLNEGWKIMFRVALAIMKLEERRLCSKTDEDLLLALKVIPEEKNVDHLMREALNIKFKTAFLEKLKEEYISSCPQVH